MADRQHTVDILMATYNGASFLEEQLASIFNQDYQGFRLVVRDDASSDATPALLARHAACRPDKVVLIDSGNRHLGLCGSYSALLERADADYVMLCDQDDVWLSDKISKVLRRMQEVERELGTDQPILVHTDLAVVDEALRVLNRSFWAYEHLDPVRGRTLKRLLVQNVATGCASMVNRALVRKAVPIPSKAVVHDWWLALVAAAFGRLECLPEVTVLYRQHGSNRIGAKRRGMGYVIRQALSMIGSGELAEGLRNAQQQAGVFLERFGSTLRGQPRSTVQAYANPGECGFLGKRLRLLRYGFYKAGVIRSIGLFGRG